MELPSSAVELGTVFPIVGQIPLASLFDRFLLALCFCKMANFGPNEEARDCTERLDDLDVTEQLVCDTEEGDIDLELDLEREFERVGDLERETEPAGDLGREMDLEGDLSGDLEGDLIGDLVVDLVPAEARDESGLIESRSWVLNETQLSTSMIEGS